jgi:hypothetical protein
MRPRSILLGSCALATILTAVLASAQTRPSAASLAAARPSDDLPAGAVKLTPVESMAAQPHPPTPSGAIRVPLALEGLAARYIDTEKLRITSGAATITRSPTGVPLLQLAGEGRVIVSSEPGENSAGHIEIRSDRKTPLPWLVIETERTDAGTVVRTARPFLTLAKAIVWDAGAQRHVAEFLFGLDQETGEPAPLTQPIDVRFAATCDEVQPAAARIAQVGPAGYGIVRVACSRAIKNQSAVQQLDVDVERGSLAYPFLIPRRPGPLALTGSTRVPGFGFGTLVLTMGPGEEDGTPMQTDTAMQVQLVADEGWLDVDAVTVPGGAQGVSVTTHPPGIGRLSVRALAGAQRSAPLTIELTWPLLPVIAMISGGMLGGYLSASRRSLAWRWLRTFEGALAGSFLTAIVLVLPSLVTLPAWTRETDLGLFALATPVGYIGTHWLERAAYKVFPALTANRTRPDANT